MDERDPASAFHSHVFLGEGHAKSERRTWAVIWLAAAMMTAEIVGGLAFGSIALVADGLHLSTHAGALLLAALAYTYARKHAGDPRFTFGTGKFGDLAGYSSAIILAMIALLIGYESVGRIFSPVPIHFAEAIPLAVVGLGVNIASVWLLSGGEGHHHHHGHHDHDHGHHDEIHRIATVAGGAALEVFENGAPPRFRLRADKGHRFDPGETRIETLRPDGSRQRFALADRGEFLESVEEIPEPHQFTAYVHIGPDSHAVEFVEHEHPPESAHRDNNMRAAMVHLLADAAVSVLVIAGLLAARAFGWRWTDPAAGIIGALVTASWAATLIRDTGAILLDMNPDHRMADKLRDAIESEGDRIGDLHLWRLGPGHLGAIVGIVTSNQRGAEYYRAKLARFSALSHITIEVRPE